MKRLRKPLKFTIITLAIVFVLVFASVNVCAVEGVSKVASLEQMSTTIDIIETNNYFKIAIVSIQLIVVFALVLTIIQLVHLKNRDAEAYVKALANCQKFLEKETEKSKKLQAELNVSKNKEDELYEWKNNAIKADCMIQDRIDLMLAKNVAAAFEERYASIEEMDESACNFTQFNSAIVAYEAMNDLQREHVTLNMNIIMEKRNVSGELLARESERYLNEVYSTTMADRFSTAKLAQAVTYYMNLPFYIKKIMDVNCFKRVNQSYHAAMKDYEKFKNQSHQSKRK